MQEFVTETKKNKSGQILDQRWKIFFVIFTKLIPRRIFFGLQNFGVDGTQGGKRAFAEIIDR